MGFKRFSSIRIVGTVALLALVLVSCAPRDAGLSRLVPEQAFGFVQISDPETFFKNIDAFVAPLGLGAMMGGQGAQGMLGQQLKGMYQLEMNEFDLKKPVGIAILPPADGVKEPGIVVYIPFVKAKESGAKLEALFKSAPNYSFTVADGYAIYSTGAKGLTFPLAKSLRLPENFRFASGAVTMYADVRNILAKYKTEWEALKQEAMSELESTNSMGVPGMANPEAAVQMTKDFISALFDFVAQTESLTMRMTLNGKGLLSDCVLNFARDGGIDKLIKAVGPGRQVTGLGRYLPENYLVTGAMNGNPAAFKDMVYGMMNMYYKMINMSEADQAAMRKLMDDSFKLSGKNVAFGFDFGVSPEIATLASGTMPSNFADLFSFGAVMVMDITDAAAYKKYMADAVGNEVLKKYMATVGDMSGFTMGLKLEEKKDGDLSYQELSITMEPKSGAVGVSAYAEIQKVMTALLGKINFKLVIKGSKVYMVMGEAGLETLKKLNASDALDKSLQNSTFYKEYVATVPADAQYVGNFSVARVLDIVTSASGGAATFSIPEGAQTGIYGYLLAKDASIEMSSYWNMKELVPVFSQAMQLVGRLMAGGLNQ